MASAAAASNGALPRPTPAELDVVVRQFLNFVGASDVSLYREMTSSSDLTAAWNRAQTRKLYHLGFKHRAPEFSVRDRFPDLCLTKE